MKKLITILLACMLTGTAYTQITFADMYVGFTLQKKDSISRQDRWAFDISKEQWLENENLPAIKQKWYSWGLSISRMFDFPIVRGVSIALGPGFRTLHHYHNGEFRSGIVPPKDTLFPIGHDYKLNKTALNYADLNAELRFRIGKQENYAKLYLGFRGGYLFNRHTKHIDGSGNKYKIYGISGFNELSYGPTLRIGYNAICLFAHYLINPVYENNTRQVIKSCSLGLTFYFL